jgi:hypothetical protein
MKVKIIKAHETGWWYQKLNFIGEEFEVKEFNEEEKLNDPILNNCYSVVDDARIHAIDNDVDVVGYYILKDDCEIVTENKDESKFAIFQMRDIWCERISEEFTEEDRQIQLKVDRDLEGYWLFCAYTDGKMFSDFICQEEVEDCARENEEYPNDEEMALLCCVGWRVDGFKNQGYKGDWLYKEN